jgi:flagellar biosynthesis/type III secretory pathway protein FliH
MPAAPPTATAFAFPALEGERIPLSQSAREAQLRLHAEETLRQAHADGLAAGRAEALEQLAPAREALLAATAVLEQTADEVVPQAEQRAVELALAIAQKVLTVSLELDPALVVSVVTGALRRAVHDGPVAIELNPADVELVRVSLDEVAHKLGGLSKLDLIGERRIARGGCVVRTVEGEIDARLDTQLERAETVLREALAPST